jgi:glutathione S-transferase
MNTLITIPISHYCEKARWALDYSRIPYKEDKHLTGFHFIATYKASRTDSVPVLKTSEGKLLTDSTDILKWCDQNTQSGLKLYPQELKEEVERYEDYLDEGLGVAGRLWMYSHMLDHISIINKYSAMHDVPKYQVKLLPLVFPFLKVFIRKGLEITPASEAEAKKIIDEAFDDVARKLSDGRQYLFGSEFTAADLTFASLAAAVLLPENYGAALPQVDELPSAMGECVSQWRKHPAGLFAQMLFSERENKLSHDR